MKGELNMRRIAVSDIPSSEDKLGIKEYTEGLAEFILNCQTPLTIAIQGDWGSGKTSIMKQVGEYLVTKKVKILNFNTWQYSQFNMDQFLAISLITDLLNELNANISSGSILKSMIDTSKQTLAGALECVDLSNFLLNSEKLVELINRNKNIAKLKSNFEENVRAYLSRTNSDRVVIFIDDLDRLVPQKAVELMEVLKLFLDCEGCVFVLAIDYEIVVSGVRQKYGEIEKDKERNFFEKLIQVPFSVPVEKYETKIYIKYLLSKISNDELTDSEMINELVLNTVGKNPRTINRLINVYSLNSTIYNLKNRLNHNNFNLPIFILACWQLAFEENYFEITKTKSTLEKFLSRLTKEENPENISSESELSDGFINILKQLLRKNKSLESDLLSAHEYTNITTVKTQNNSSLQLQERQEQFWTNFINTNEVNQLEALSDFTQGTIGKRNYIYYNGKKSSKIYELYSNKNSLMVMAGTYHKKNGSEDIKKIILENESNIKKEISDKLNESDNKDSEVNLTNNSNYTGFTIRSTQYGLDISAVEDCINWFTENIDILHSVMQKYWK